METQIRVQCYAGHKADERPVSFALEERTLLVREIVDRWYDVDGDYFKVVADDGATYLLRHGFDNDDWVLVS